MKTQLGYHLMASHAEWTHCSLLSDKRTFTSQHCSLAQKHTFLSLSARSFVFLNARWAWQVEGPVKTQLGYSGVTLNVARPDMNNYATLGVMLC